MKISTTHYTLKAQPHWPEARQIPHVTVDCTADAQMLRFSFDVTEPLGCFRQICRRDGDPCWQDSCVEVFLRSGTGYYNFECNSAGCCLGEYGASRSPRRPFSAEEYAQIRRTAHCRIGSAARWQLEIAMPREFVGLLPEEEVVGNLYKCASNAEIPHYLCAFPVLTPTPDFHRPEFFASLYRLESFGNRIAPPILL